MIFVGPSGCGKTTALRMVAGLEEISEGEISIGGRVVNDLEPKERDVAMVFQNYALYPHMRVRDNIAFPLKMQRLPKAEIDERVAEAVRLLGIEELLHRKPRELSGGQRQRVAMGRATRSPPAGVPDGRAAVEPGREAARADAGGAREAAPAPRRDDAVRDPRPDGGDDARRAGRGAAPGGDPAGRPARSGSTTIRRTRSSRASSGRRR